MYYDWKTKLMYKINSNFRIFCIKNEKYQQKNNKNVNIIIKSMQKPKKLNIEQKEQQIEEPVINKDNHIDSESDQDQHLSQDQAYILDPHQYLKLCLKDKKIKVMDQCNPIMNNVYLKDISLHKKGPLEDKIYSKNDLYYCNIRRGNTLCQIFDEKQQESALFMCRRGMKKFYDLEPQYMKVNRKLTHQHERYRRRIFQGLDKILDSGNQGYQIHLYGLFKQNGQHCQISYVKQLGYWLFASKNVAILAKNQEQLVNHYEKQRFYWAKLIGHEFFKTLNTFSQEKKQQFMKDIDGKTLLGEHCGNQQHQHITKYQKIQIIFYGLVDNNGKDHCLPVQQCQNFLNKYGLKMSKMQKVEGLKQKNKVYFNMFKMLKRVAQGTMEQCGQGSVLYIVSEDSQGKQKTVGMCKLKTCQYLIYRRMREMIKIYFSKKGATANSFEKYKFEVESLCEHYFKPPKPLEYYFQIAQLAFNEVKKNGKQFNDDEFRYKFVNFLETVESKAAIKKQEKVENQDEKPEIKRIVLVCPPLLHEEIQKIQKLCKRLSISIEYGYRQDPTKKLTKSNLHILHLVPRLNLDEIQNNTIIVTYEIQKQQLNKIVGQLTQNPDIKKSHLISFIKSEDKQKSIQLLNDKISVFGHSCTQKNKDKNKQANINIRRANKIQQVLDAIASKAVKNGDQVKMQKKAEVNQSQFMKQEEQYGNKFMITVIMTLLIPGSGKSTLADTFSALDEQEIQVISSDKIRQSVMQKYKGKRKGQQVQSQQAYAATKKKGLEKYREAVKQAIGEQPPSQNRILYIDRLFCPTTIFDNVEQIRKPWTKFIIVTQTQNQARLNDYIYPRSLGYLLGCIKRCLEREDHETLSTKPSQIVRVILKFYQMYRGYTYNKLNKQLQDANIDCQIMHLDFLKQKDEPQNLFLRKKVEQCLKGISPGHDAPESPLYTELIELIYKYSDHIERKKTQQTQAQKEELLKFNAQKLMKACK